MSKQTTLRSKVEEFFNPGPTNHLDNDGADSNDEHQMQSFFTRRERQDVQAHLPKRKLHAEIELNPKFSAKQVTRAELNK